LWAGLDAIWLLAVNDIRLANYNLKNPSQYNLTWYGTYTFTAYAGITGDGSSGYGDTGMARNALGLSYSQNSAALSSWSPSAVVNADYTIGTYPTGGLARLSPYFTAYEIHARLNTTTNLSNPFFATGSFRAHRVQQGVGRNARRLRGTNRLRGKRFRERPSSRNPPIHDWRVDWSEFPRYRNIPRRYSQILMPYVSV
jgi:hypothetical protein